MALTVMLLMMMRKMPSEGAYKKPYGYTLQRGTIDTPSAHRNQLKNYLINGEIFLLKLS